MAADKNKILKFNQYMQSEKMPYIIYVDLESIDDCEKFNETTLHEKEQLYSNLKMDDITGADCMHWKRTCKEFEVKNLGEYHDLYLRSNVLLLANVFENNRKMCLKIYELNPAKFLWAPRLAWQATLKKTEIELITDIDILLMF